MYKQGIYKESDRMSDLISDNYPMLLVTSRFGIALGFGDKSIGEVCRMNHVDPFTFLTVVNFLTEETSVVSEATCQKLSIDTLVKYLHNAHDYFLNFRLPHIRRKLVDAIENCPSDVAFVIRRYFEPDAATCPAERELAQLIARVKFSFAYQDEATGTANAVLLAREFTGDEPFAVMYGDDVILNDGGDPCLKQLADAYARTGRSVIGVQERAPEEAAKYAVVKKGRTEGRLTEVLDLVEKPSPDNMPSTLSSLGRYVLTPAIYDAIAHAPEFRGEKYLTHAIAILAGTEGVDAYEFEGTRYDLGDKFGFLQANVEIGARRFGERFESYLESYLKSLRK